jgi:hypothetical protein
MKHESNWLAGNTCAQRRYHCLACRYLQLPVGTILFVALRAVVVGGSATNALVLRVDVAGSIVHAHGFLQLLWGRSTYLCGYVCMSRGSGRFCHVVSQQKFQFDCQRNGRESNTFL